MKTSIPLWTVCAALAWAGSVAAHHSISMFDITTPIWVEGTIVSFERVNPHSRITLEAASEDGRTVQWVVEGPALFQLDRRGVDNVVVAGDVVRFCAFALKDEFSSRGAALDDDPSSPRFVHGHVLITADGNRRLWGSYGNLVECIRSTASQMDSWLSFLDSSDTSVRALWCGQRRAARRLAQQDTAEHSVDFADEVNARLSNPCD